MEETKTNVNANEEVKDIKIVAKSQAQAKLSQEQLAALNDIKECATDLYNDYRKFTDDISELRNKDATYEVTEALENMLGILEQIKNMKINETRGIITINKDNYDKGEIISRLIYLTFLVAVYSGAADTFLEKSIDAETYELSHRVGNLAKILVK
jgi:hypothetical protein